MPSIQVIHRRIQQRMRTLDLTQADVAKGLGMASSSVSDWFSKGALPDGAAMLRLPKVLRCSANWLLLGVGPEIEVPESQRDQAMRAVGARDAIDQVRDFLEELTTSLTSGPATRGEAERRASVKRVLQERKAGAKKGQPQPKTGSG